MALWGGGKKEPKFVPGRGLVEDGVDAKANGGTQAGTATAANGDEGIPLAEETKPVKKAAAEAPKEDPAVVGKKKFDLLLGNTDTQITKVGENFRIVLPEGLSKADITQLFGDYGITDAKAIVTPPTHTQLGYTTSKEVMERALISVGVNKDKVASVIGDAAKLTEIVQQTEMRVDRPGFENAVVTIDETGKYTISKVKRNANPSTIFAEADIYEMEPNPDAPGTQRRKMVDKKPVQKMGPDGQPLIKAHGEGAYAIVITSAALEVGNEVTISDEVRKKRGITGASPDSKDESPEVPVKIVDKRFVRHATRTGGDDDGLRILDVNEPDNTPWSESLLNPDRGRNDLDQYVRSEDKVKALFAKKLGDKGISVIFKKGKVNGEGRYELHVPEDFTAKDIAKAGLGLDEKDINVVAEAPKADAKEGEKPKVLIREVKARWHVPKALLEKEIDGFAKMDAQKRAEAIAALETPEKMAVEQLGRLDRESLLKAVESEKEQPEGSEKPHTKRLAKLVTETKGKPGLSEVKVSEDGENYVLDNVVPGTSRERLFATNEPNLTEKKDSIDTAVIGPKTFVVSEAKMHEKVLAPIGQLKQTQLG